MSSICFPTDNTQATKILLTNFDDIAQAHALTILGKLREKDIPSEIYPESAKLKKQMTYADKKSIPYVLMIGSREMETGIYSLKNMTSGEQKEVSIDQLLNELS